MPQVSIVLGIGLLIFGLTGFHGGGVRALAGWDTDAQIYMAIGAMLIALGLLWRQQSR